MRSKNFSYKNFWGHEKFLRLKFNPIQFSVKPTLKKVSKYDNKFKKFAAGGGGAEGEGVAAAPKADFRSQLKVVKKDINEEIAAKVIKILTIIHKIFHLDQKIRQTRLEGTSQSWSQGSRRTKTWRETSWREEGGSCSSTRTWTSGRTRSCWRRWWGRGRWWWRRG